MHLDPDIFYHFVPVLLLLIGVEAIFMMKEKREDNKDMFSSFFMALGHIPFSALTKGIVLFLYFLIYQFRFFTLPINCWWAWVICFFCDDLSYYWFHRFSHKLRFLWASHKVHHSSKKYRLSTGFRVPWTGDLSGTFLFWAWMPLIGFDPYMILFMKSASAIYQFWLHTETIHKLPKWFEAVFNTPSHHRVHHGSDLAYLDKNHAGNLIIWDKMFGTYQEEIFTPTYGLTENITSYNPFVIAFDEWNKIIQDIKKAKLLKDRFNYFFDTPGWSHDGSTKTTKQLQDGLEKSQSIQKNHVDNNLKKNETAIIQIKI